VFDADAGHFGVFSMETNRATILPEATREPTKTLFRSVIGDHVFVSAYVRSDETELVGFIWPSWAEQSRIRLPDLIMDPVPRDETTLYATRILGRSNEIVGIDSRRYSARRLGYLRARNVRRLALVDRGVIFAGSRMMANLWSRKADGTQAFLTREGNLWSAGRCGEGFVISRQPNSKIERIDSVGRHLAEMTSGPRDRSPACSPDGKVLYFVRAAGAQPGLYRCDAVGCRRLAADVGLALDVSPDGTRLAYLDIGPGGPRVALLSVEGGEPRYLVESEGACAPGWSSATTLWVSRRQRGRPLWIEVDAEKGTATGRIHVSAKDCLDGTEDPASPIHPDFGIAEEDSFELRFLSRELIDGR
jgi:hypothetical protein